MSVAVEELPVALVTGASGDIGLAIARRLHAAGWGLALQYRSQQEPLRELMGESASAHRADLTVADDVEALFAAVDERWGRIDCLVNCAGVLLERTDFLSSTPELWRTTFDLNVLATVACTHAALTRMVPRGAGVIVNVSSNTGRLGGKPGETVHYGASKAALNALTRGLALEFAPHGIRVVGVAPGLIESKLHDRFRAAYEQTVPTIPLGRAGTPEEVAELVAYLVSEHGAFITAEVVHLAGWSMTRTLFLEELTSQEISDAVAAGARTLIVPMGAIEAHGAHLPVNTDNAVSRHVAALVAERLGDALVAPVVAFGYTPRMRFAGTISVPVTVVMALLDAYCAAAERDGFEAVLLLPMHAESIQTCTLHAAELADAHPELVITPCLDVEGFLALRNVILDRFGVTTAEAGWHAGAAETAEMLAIDASAVLMDQARPGYPGPAAFGQVQPETLSRGWVVLDERGVMGDPTKATTEMGAAIFDGLVEYIAGAVQRTLPAALKSRGRQ